MRRLFSLFLCLGLSAALLAGCDSSDDESGVVTVEGFVFDAARNQPIAGAFVTIQAADNPSVRERQDIILETDAEGRYSTSFEVTEATDVVIVARRDGFTADTQVIFAVGERSIEVPRFRLDRTRDADPTSGTPSNILLSGLSTNSIGVVESGSQEVAVITFQVADSAGRPVTIENEALVRFRLGQQPGGDAFISPEEAGTDDNGQVDVNLSSGTRAGVVQIVAETVVDGEVIESKPVSVTIHGGLPDQNHFTLGPNQFNFAGLPVFGRRNGISVLIGDKFSNPVRPGTAVYFSTTHGVIQGSTTTSADGQGTVDLISGRPLPLPEGTPRPVGAGISVIRAETAGTDDEQNEDAPGYGEELIFAEIPVLFSGLAGVETPPELNAPELGRTYVIRVRDGLGNPLAPGAQLTVEAGGTNVKIEGDAAYTFADTAINTVRNAQDEIISANAIVGPGITEFRFRAVGDRSEQDQTEPELESITIRVTGPNGQVQRTFTVGGTAAQKGDDVQVSTLRDGYTRYQAAEM